ncbi:hypothetical protein HNV12_16330 [Methanococcoides sp. SA1]|nr:hypothetical protein [Methanococcoides sp. SA1]
MDQGRGPIKAISILCVLAFAISVGCVSISEPPTIAAFPLYLAHLLFFLSIAMRTKVL